MHATCLPMLKSVPLYSLLAVAEGETFTKRNTKQNRREIHLWDKQQSSDQALALTWERCSAKARKELMMRPAAEQSKV